MKLKFAFGAVGTVALVGLATALPATAVDRSQVSVEEMLPVLASPQVASDRVPASVGLSDLGDISEESIRSLGNDGIANYWVARAGTSEICLILEIPNEKMSASSCGSITNFYHHGLSLAAGPSVNEPSNSTVAYLLPADINPNDILASQTNRRDIDLESGLVTSRPHESTVTPSKVRRDDGSIFKFAPVSIRKS